MTVWVTHITAHPLALKFLLPTSPHRFCRLRLPPSPSPTWTFSLISPTGCPPLCNQQTFKPSRTSPTCQRIFPTSCYGPSRPDVRQTLLYREVSSPAQARPTYSLNFWSLTSACKISFAIQETIALRRPRPPSIAFCRPQPRDSTLSWLRPWHNESSLPAGRCHGTSRSAGHCHKTPRSIGHCRGSSSAGSPSATDHRLRPIIACDRDATTARHRPSAGHNGSYLFLRLLPWDIALHRLLPRNIVRRITACDRLSPATATPQLRDIAPAGHCHGTSRPANHRLGRTVACDQPSRHTSEPSTTKLKNIYVPVIAVSPRPREPLLCQCTKS